MPIQTVTLQVPEVLYARLKERAAQTNRTVEAEVLEVLTGAVPVADDIEAALSPLAVLSDDALWQAAQSRLATETAASMEQLHIKQQREGLTNAERDTLAAQVRQYERQMLVRAKAAALLQQRGHDVSTLAHAS
jgi:plasmid stability protein